LFWRACYEAKNFLPRKKIGTGILVFETLYEVELFLYKKGHAFWFSKCLTSFFFPLVPFGRKMTKQKTKKKKKPSLWCFVLDKA
jgi:hypothetical protein